MSKQSNAKPVTDTALLDKWVREYANPLRAYFGKRMSPPEEANDLVQEVFVRLSKRSDLANIDRIEGYIFQTASSVLTDFFRKGTNKAGRLESFDESRHGKAQTTPEHLVESRQNLQRVVDVLHDLPELTGRIFMLYHLENMRQKEIARFLGMPLSTLEKHMARANRHLLRHLGKKDERIG